MERILWIVLEVRLPQQSSFTQPPSQPWRKLLRALRCREVAQKAAKAANSLQIQAIPPHLPLR